MKPKSAIAKGKVLENFIVQWLRNKKLDEKAIRTPGSGNGRFRGDVYTPNLPVVIECKNQKTPHLAQWIEQAEGQTFGYSPWVLVWHPPGQAMESSVAVIPLELLEILFRSINTQKI